MHKFEQDKKEPLSGFKKELTSIFPKPEDIRTLTFIRLVMQSVEAISAKKRTDKRPFEPTIADLKLHYEELEQALVGVTELLSPLSLYKLDAHQGIMQPQVGRTTNRLFAQAKSAPFMTALRFRKQVDLEQEVTPHETIHKSLSGIHSLTQLVQMALKELKQKRGAASTFHTNVEQFDDELVGHFYTAFGTLPPNDRHHAFFKCLTAAYKTIQTKIETKSLMHRLRKSKGRIQQDIDKS